ncbi:glycosyltransferase family 4 protein [Acinetobacter indicus]|uniref:glycosyltransferase family 4 protein n=1 Tax=Acinetobacter indicus TaxID=756892 RepID=UPI0013626CFC|nr:glycosyltransferase family 4 protein [Acinetobacter indicus]
MKIIYFHQYFNTPEMSSGTRSYEMARRLVAAGHEVHMIASSRKPTSKDWYTTNEAGIKVHWFPNYYDNSLSYKDRIKSFFRFAWHAVKKGKTFENVDLVFATSTPLTIAIPAVLTARHFKVPMVFEVRDLWPELPIAMGALKNPFTRRAAHALENWAYRNSSSIIALSPGMRDGIVKTGYPANRVAVIPNSSDNDLFEVDDSLVKEYRSKFNWLQDHPLVTYTGTFGVINGVCYIVDIAAKAYELDSNIKFLLVGSGAEFEKVQSYAREKGVLNKNLYMMGRIPKKEIPVLLKAATISTALFIDKPEMRSNSANKFFDSLAAGTPILINYGGWMADIINESKCGLVLWNKSIDQAAEELVLFLNNRELISSSQNNAKNLAKHKFCRDRLAKQFIQVLELAVDGKSDTTASITREYYH